MRGGDKVGAWGIVSSSGSRISLDVPSIQYVEKLQAVGMRSDDIRRICQTDNRQALELSVLMSTRKDVAIPPNQLSFVPTTAKFIEPKHPNIYEDLIELCSSLKYTNIDQLNPWVKGYARELKDETSVIAYKYELSVALENSRLSDNFDFSVKNPH